MKKFLSVLLSLAMLIAFTAVPASAASKFTAEITNTASTVAVGEKLEITVTVSGVASGTSLAAVEFNISYNPSYLKPVYAQNEVGDTTRFTSTPSDSEWEHILADHGSSFYCFLSPADGGSDASALGSGDTLTLVLLFEVLDGANGHTVNVGINSLIGYDATDLGLETTVVGTASGYSFNAALPTKPIANLGASINISRPAIRLGAQYKSAYLGSLSASEIKSLGILYCPTELLGDAVLTESTSGAVKLSATLDGGINISKIAQYENVVFYITFNNIPADEMDKEYSFRAYVSTADETILADTTCTRSYQYVYDVLYPSVGTAPGDNVIYPGTGWFE